MRGALVLVCSTLALSAFARPALCQQSDDSDDSANNKRIFWIIPNFRTSATLAVYKPLTPSEKFKIARQDIASIAVP